MNGGAMNGSAMNGEDGRGAIVVDMGGTTTRVGHYRGGALAADPTRFDTPKPGPGGSVREAHLDLIAAEADRLRGAVGPAGRLPVGVAVGATVDGTGRIRNASMLWHEPATGFDLVTALVSRLPWADVVAVNDIAAAAWRYRHLGRFALITVSTGVAIKIFDDGLPLPAKLVQDVDGLGGEIGHVLVNAGGDGDTLARYRSLGPAAAAGDDAARAALADAQVAWCECGNVGDLCSYTSGPAVVRNAAARARALPDQWRESKLAVLCDGDAARITTHTIASAARSGDAFTHGVLRAATRPLAGQILQTSAELGLRRFVLMGGLVHGVGEPWFAALRQNLADLLPLGAWFTGWSREDVAGLVEPSIDGDDSLVGMGRYLDALRSRSRELYKPTGESRTVLRHRSRPRCGREQFVARIAFAGVCGTDLQILRGERGCEPGVLGHECVARVVEVGADVSGLRAGEVIGVNPNHPHDEHDKLGHNLPGVWRETAVWDGHLADRGQAVPLPADGRAEWVLMEPLACVLRSLDAAGRDWTGRRVLVAGAGISGLLHALMARRLGARQVLVANRGTERLRFAARRNILDAGDCLRLDADLPHAVREATEGNGVDAVLMAVSGVTGRSIVESLWPVLADGATVHLFSGFAQDAVLCPPGATPESGVPVQRVRRGQWRTVPLPDGRNCVLVGTRGASREDYEAARDLCAAPAGLDLAPLISHVISLDAAPAVLDEMAATGAVRGGVALRVVVDLRLPGHSVRVVDGVDLPRLGDR
jgi:threonine dehydrogenase-like Zn-dependent dehydrogenase/predicted NBD/HSP70 family sugar kinase